MATQSLALRKKPQGLAALWQVQNLRRLVQLAFALFIAYTVVVHAIVGETSGVTTASGEAFCPFGGFEALYRYVTSGGQSFVPHTHLSNMVLFVGLMVTTVLMRGVFCGWVCPFGAIQEWLNAGSVWLQKRVPPIGRAVKALSGRINPRPALRLGQDTGPTWGQRLDTWLRYVKYGLLLWIIWGTITYGVMVFRDIDPWAALLNLAEGAAIGGLIMLGVTLVLSLFVERPWCRYLCPLGAIVGLVGKVSPVRIQREGTTCSGCALCDRKCPMGIPVAVASDITDASCVMCLRCVDSCPKPGALELKLMLPGVKA